MRDDYLKIKITNEIQVDNKFISNYFWPFDLSNPIFYFFIKKNVLRKKIIDIIRYRRYY